MKTVPKSALPTKLPEETLPKSSLRLYTQKAHHDILPPEKEQELGRLIQQGDKNAWEELVRSNLRLVISLAKKYSRNREDLFQDLIQSGNIGLMRAAKTFDPESEIAIKKTIESMRKTMTLIVIAHRVSTITNADTLLVLKEGAIIEYGNPQEILLNPESYLARMATLQHHTK